jgi:hypothetical protein
VPSLATGAECNTCTPVPGATYDGYHGAAEHQVGSFSLRLTQSNPPRVAGFTITNVPGAGIGEDPQPCGWAVVDRNYLNPIEIQPGAPGADPGGFFSSHVQPEWHFEGQFRTGHVVDGVLHIVEGNCSSGGMGFFARADIRTGLKKKKCKKAKKRATAAKKKKCKKKRKKPGSRSAAALPQAP